MGAPPPPAIVLVLVLDIEGGLGMECRNNPRARIDGTPNTLGEAFLEDEDDDEDEDDYNGAWHVPPSSCTDY
jgi:hypothetical protein